MIKRQTEVKKKGQQKTRMVMMMTMEEKNNDNDGVGGGDASGHKGGRRMRPSMTKAWGDAILHSQDQLPNG